MGLLDNFLRVFVGSRNERQIRNITREVARINALEPEMAQLSDDQLRAKTTEFRHRLDAGASEDDLLHEAFAVVREAAKRTIGQRHYDVQLIGGIILHQGSIAEMVTGEGKTLTATCPLYLNALKGRGVHVVTVNDYLARLHAEWMANVFRLLGLTCGYIQAQMENRERRQMYACDITYGTNSEFGFDYLRDNMKQNPQDQVQRGLNFCVVDEVDSILVDEARTPLIISGPAQDYSDLYARADGVAAKLEGIQDKVLKEKLGKDANVRELYLKALGDYDFEIREKESQCLLTDRGIENVEKLLGIGHLYSAQNQGWPHMIEQALRARHIFKRDKNYVVQDGEKGAEIVIVDEFTGRLQHGRRWSDGLHQAIEAKEGIKVREESVTYATVTLQNYFKLYKKLAGMTGTAITEAAEFDTIYKLDVVAVPTNRALIRHDRDDLIYGSEGEKFQAVVAEIVMNHLAGRPCLVGTTSVLKSERLADLLGRTSVRISGGKLSIRTPAFRLPAPGSGRRGSASEMEEIKVEPRVMELDCIRDFEGRFEIRLPDPSIRIGNPKADPRIETWFAIRPEYQPKLREESGFIGVAHNVLNAKLHAMEADIVAQAGHMGAVTIATNMAGRGTDILLGGNGEHHTRLWLKREQGVELSSLLPEEFRETPSYLIPRQVLLQAEKDYDARVKATYAERFKAEFDATHEEIVKLGGLAVIGTERHESRRIDNQLRGRCGRQGDPGSSQFFISLDDDLMRLFAGPRIRTIMKSLGLRDGEAIQARMITRSVERAQRKIEGHHFDIRKNLKEYDDVLDLQRKTIYRLRQSIIEGVDREAGAEIDAHVRGFLNELLGTEERVNEDQATRICLWMKEHYGIEWKAEVLKERARVILRDGMILGAKLSKLPAAIDKALEDRVYNVINRLAADATPGDDPQQWNTENLNAQLGHIFDAQADTALLTQPHAAQLADALSAYGVELYKNKRKEIVTTPTGEENPDRLTSLGRFFLLRAMDGKWQEHLRNMEQLRYGIHWEAQAQKDPKTVYKKEGLALFEQLLDDIDTDVVRSLFHVKIEYENAPPPPSAARTPQASTPLWSRTQDIGARALQSARAAADAAKARAAAQATAVQTGPLKREKRLSPNDNCWCGSGKKYKKCHMASDGG